MIQVIGKKSFVGKNETRFFLLFYGFPNENTIGLEVASEFVSEAVYNKAKVNGRYEPIYGRNYSGRAVINDLESVNG